MRTFIYLRFFPALFFVLFLGSATSFENTLEAEEVRGELVMGNYKGRVVYFDFWASWCVPCRKSFPWLNEIQKKYKSKGLEVVTINLDKKKELAANFLKDFPNVDLKVIYDPEGVYAQKYKIMGMPSSLIFDRDGHLTQTHVGFKTTESDKYEEEIKKLL